MSYHTCLLDFFSWANFFTTSCKPCPTAPSLESKLAGTRFCIGLVALSTPAFDGKCGSNVLPDPWELSAELLIFWFCCDLLLFLLLALVSLGGDPVKEKSMMEFFISYPITSTYHSLRADTGYDRKKKKYYNVIYLLYNIFCCTTIKLLVNPIALRMAKTPLSFGHSGCNRVKGML